MLEWLSERYPPERALRDEPMARHTTFRVGGPADALVFPETADDLLWTLDRARREGAACVIVGNGSNLIVKDGGVRGVVLCTERMNRVSVEGNALRAEAGAPLSRVAREAQSRGLSGLSFASGIPGTLGGGVTMNAGAYGGELADTLVRAWVLKDGVVRERTREQMRMGYRASAVQADGSVVLEAEFLLEPGDPEAILREMNELNRRRREKQPLTLPSAGSTFKRPEGHFAAALIEQAGLKGAREGGAMVSELHAGFLVNAGGATAKDVLALMARVQSEVYGRFGVRLEPEVRIMGEDEG